MSEARISRGIAAQHLDRQTRSRLEQRRIPRFSVRDAPDDGHHRDRSAPQSSSRALEPAGQCGTPDEETRDRKKDDVQHRRAVPGDLGFRNGRMAL